MKVLLIPSSDYLGHPFPQRHNHIFEHLQEEEDLEVHVIRFKLYSEQKLDTELVVHEIDDLETNSIGLYYSLNLGKHVTGIRKIVKEEEIDLIIFSNIVTPFFYLLMEGLSELNVPMIFDLPDYYPTSGAGYIFNTESIPGRILTGSFSSILCFMLNRVEKVTAASESLVKFAEEVGAKDVDHIPNGISSNFQEIHDGESLRKELGFTCEDVVVGYLGSIGFWLDLKSLIQGISMAKKKGVPVKLFLIGEGLHSDYSNKVKRWIKKEEIQDEVIWKSFVPHSEVPKYMSAFDFGTIPFDSSNPTAYYAAPNKLWEYLSQMTPVLSSPIPATVKNREYLSIVSTPSRYARKILDYSNDNPKIERKKETGREAAIRRTWKRSARRMKESIKALF